MTPLYVILPERTPFFTTLAKIFGLVVGLFAGYRAAGPVAKQFSAAKDQGSAVGERVGNLFKKAFGGFFSTSSSAADQVAVDAKLAQELADREIAEALDAQLNS